MFARLNRWRNLNRGRTEESNNKSSFDVISSTKAEQENQCEPPMISNSICESICDWNNPGSTAELDKIDKGTDREFQKPLVMCSNENDEKEIFNQTTSKETSLSAVENRIIEEKDRDSGIDSDSRGTSPQEKKAGNSISNSVAKGLDLVTSPCRQRQTLVEKECFPKVSFTSPNDESSDKTKKVIKQRRNHHKKQSKGKKINSKTVSSPDPIREKYPLVAIETGQNNNCSCKKLCLPHKGLKCPFRCILEIRTSRRTNNGSFYICSSISPTMDGELLKPNNKHINKRKDTTDITSANNLDSSDNSRRQPIRTIFNNINALSKKIAQFNQLLNAMRTERRDLEIVLRTVQCWSVELRNVSRTSLGVPYIRAVKSILGKQKECMTRKKGEFLCCVTRLKESRAPGFDRAYNLLLRFKKDITSIAQDQQKYSAKHVEELRLLLGRIIGTFSAIISLYYEE